MADVVSATKGTLINIELRSLGALQTALGRPRFSTGGVLPLPIAAAARVGIVLHAPTPR